MPAARKRRLWDPQQVPSGPIELNWAHPLSAGLVGFWPLNGTLTDLVGITPLASVAPAIFAIGQNGPLLQRATTANTGTTGIQAPIGGTGEISSFFQFATTVGVVSNANYALQITDGGAYHGLTHSVEGGVLWGRFNGATASGGSGFNDGKIHSFGLVKPAAAAANGVSIYGDGMPLALTLGGTSTTELNIGTTYFDIGFGHAGSYGFIGSISGLRLYSRVLSGAEMAWLTAEPWSMVQRLPRRTYSIPASSSVSGSAAITEAADIAAALGSMGVAGTAAANESADAVAGTGAAGASGAAAIAEGADTASATGALSTSGAGAAAESADAVTGTGALSTQGGASVAEASDVAAGTGAAGAAGSAAITEGADTAAATGSQAVAGAATLSEAPDAASGTGTAGSGAVAAIIEPSDAASGSGSLSTSGTGAAAEASDAVSGTGAIASTGTAAIAEGPDTASGTGSIKLQGSAAIQESADIAYGTSQAPPQAACKLGTIQIGQSTIGVLTRKSSVSVITTKSTLKVLQ